MASRLASGSLGPFEHGCGLATAADKDATGFDRSADRIDQRAIGSPDDGPSPRNGRPRVARDQRFAVAPTYCHAGVDVGDAAVGAVESEGVDLAVAAGGKDCALAASGM